MKIAIDGPAGSGKSTVAKRLARELGYQYIDTGAMYRALTAYFLDRDITNETDIEPLLVTLNMDIIPGGIRINDTDLTFQLRTERIDEHVSYYSSLKSIRDWAVKRQREIASQMDVVMDGRDIGTVVYPDAELKFYLKADPNERAKRRALERNEIDNYAEILLDILRRDQLDSNRTHSPLSQADDAIVVDTTKLTIEQVVRFMKDHWDEKTAKTTV
ncbi:MAG: (d)CMP kinase [Tissierellia bacterium]|jgi:cytidylate kinase|nr:(d)CMP kinase [Tissierellia bacterium]